MDFKQGVIKSDLPSNHILLWLKFDLVAFVFFLGAPFKCKEDVLARNKQVHLCQTKTAVEPEDVSIFEGS